MGNRSTITCPICKQGVLVSDPEFPFCGERCRLLDLGNWASERYKVSTSGSQADPFSSTAISQQTPTREGE